MPGPRARWHLLANAPVLAWLVAFAVVALVHRWVPAAGWLLSHTVLLGAVSTAVMVWSGHFAEALLRLPGAGRGRGMVLRLVTLQVGALCAAAGVVAEVSPLVPAGAALVAGAVIAHAVALVRMLRRALPARFAVTVRYYVAAALLLPPGVAAGAGLAREVGDDLAARLLLAHVAVAVLGWVLLTVVGTLLTLWPSMLRTRIAEGAERAARRALPVMVGGVLLTAAAVLVAPVRVAAAGVAVVLAGLVIAGRPLVSAARSRPPRTFAAWSVLASAGWLVGGLVALAVALATAAGAEPAAERIRPIAVPLMAGFAGQVLLGALAFLVPVVLGGGPAAVRRSESVLERGGAARLTMANAALLVCVLPAPSYVRVTGSLLVLAALIGFLVLLLVATLGALRGSRGPATSVPDGGAPVPAPAGAVPATTRSHPAVGAGAGLAVVVLAVALGAAADPVALGLGRQAGAGEVRATGRTTEVTVTAIGMRFEPAAIDVPAGDRLVIVLVNRGGDRHDLVLEDGTRSPRLAPGAQARLELGPVGRDLQGWCSVVGHRQMGMTLQIRVTGAGLDAATRAERGAGSGREPAAGIPSPEHTGHGGSHPAGHGEGHTGTGDDPVGLVAWDASLPPAPASTVHRRTLVVQEVEREVAPGRRQRMWTYGGTVPGPVLRGAVGDVFEITLVNDGTIGHSIDFHAGALAPDRPMRTIQPGESLTYRFTAGRSGIWMYHCGTMPMSVHIANGMFGAVIIDPPDLEPVDREYLLVQSELYLGADTVDPDKVLAERPDLVAFNGYADQYRHRPLAARVGERVRFWVLDAGPSRSSAFHVVGGQFDAVYLEGAHRLRRGEAGGAQVLGLFPAQGGFVELTFPEPGRYPFVSHAMVDAERGAAGLVAVTP